jgi:uncharacterized protein
MLTSTTQLDRIRATVQPNEGLIPTFVHGSDELHAHELRTVFERSWLFVAHESEVAEPGDFVTREMGDRPVIVPDVNLLLYAEIDAFPDHVRARQWWEELLNGDRQIGIAAVAMFGFVRISTNRRVFTNPLAVTDALGRVRRWLDQPNVTFLVPGTRFLELAFQLLDRPGQRRLRDMREVRCPVEVERLARGQEIADLVHLHDASPADAAAASVR